MFGDHADDRFVIAEGGADSSSVVVSRNVGRRQHDLFGIADHELGDPPYA